MATSAYIYRVLTTYGKAAEMIEAELNMAGGAGFNVRDVIQENSGARGAFILLERYTTLDDIVEGHKE